MKTRSTSTKRLITAGLLVIVALAAAFVIATRETTTPSGQTKLAEVPREPLAPPSAIPQAHPATPTLAPSDVSSNAPLAQSNGIAAPAPNPPAAPPLEPTAVPATRVGYAAQPSQSGERATAAIDVDGKRIEVAPNQIGNFQRVFVAPGAQVPIRVNYPEAEAGEVVNIEAEDGGLIAESKSVGHVAKLDAEKTLPFHFTVTEEPGIHRVVLRKGADVKTLDLWVGPELPVAQNR